jgi:hypothetical protein
VGIVDVAWAGAGTELAGAGTELAGVKEQVHHTASAAGHSYYSISRILKLSDERVLPTAEGTRSCRYTIDENAEATRLCCLTF